MGPKEKIKVGLVQIGDEFGGQYYFPYSIGLLQAYAQAHLKKNEDFEFLPHIYKRSAIAEAIECLINADIIFFGTYLWNYRISLEIARGIKQRNDDCIIVFGGPQIPESPTGMEIFLKNYPFVNIACYSEGEIPFLKILENAKEQTWKNVPSIGFTGKDQCFIYSKQAERILNLDTIPSPYLEGVFDSIMEANPNEKWSALIETNRGCPYTCDFCYWGKKTKNRIHSYSIERIFKEIDWFSRQKIEFVFACDANFGLFQRDLDIAVKVAENKKKYGYPMAFSVQNTKNSTEKIFLLQKILNDAGLQKGVNLALQSVNEPTLESINRVNITNRNYRELQQKFAQSNIPTFSDIIIGLPNETYDTFTSGVSSLIESGQHNRIQFINLTVLENTVMAEPEYQERYGFLTKKVNLTQHHSSIEDKPEVMEKQIFIVGTNTMPPDEWVKTRIFCWLMALFYFNKLLQIPFVLVNKVCGIGFRKLIEMFMEVDSGYRTVSEILTFFTKKARDIQNGDCEYIASREWLNIWWPADEYIFIKLCLENELAAFYKESEAIISGFINKNRLQFSPVLLHDAIELNKQLIKLPFNKSDIEISLHYNILEVYHDILEGIDSTIKEGIYTYTIDKTSVRWLTVDDWLRDVVWYGTKKGSYLYHCDGRL